MFPEDEELAAERIAALARSGEIEAALSEARRRRDRPWAARLALKLLCRHDRHREAAPLEELAALADPADPDLFECRAARVRRDPDSLLRLCDEVLAHEPGAAHALHHRMAALAMLGRGAEAQALLGLEHFFRSSPLPIPTAFDENHFLKTLAAEIRANTTLHPDPAGHATSNGLRTDIFPAVGDRAGPDLVAAIREEVDGYAESLRGDHPFVLARPERARFTPWALIFSGSGYQHLHVHPGCWLTGVFYVAAPEGLPRPGAIRIGALPAWAKVDPPWPVLEIEPEPGRLLLFPSFLPHETLPSASEEPRISVAFDVAAV